MKNNDWLFNTLAVGILPYLIRVLIILGLESTPSWDMFLSEFDFITFCLVVNVSNINHISSTNVKDDILWKKLMTRGCFFFVIVCLVFYTILIVKGLRNLQDVNLLFLKIGSIIVIFSSVLLTTGIHLKLNSQNS